MEILYGKEQIYVVIAFFAVGLILGVVYDILIIKRMFFGSYRIIVFFDDLLFMGIFTLMFIFTSFAFNNGNIKWYEFPCLLFGFTLYKKTLSGYVIRLFIIIKNVLKKIFGIIVFPLLRVKEHISEYIKILCLKFYTYTQRKKMKRIRVIIKGV